MILLVAHRFEPFVGSAGLLLRMDGKVLHPAVRGSTVPVLDTFGNRSELQKSLPVSLLVPICYCRLLRFCRLRRANKWISSYRFAWIDGLEQDHHGTMSRREPNNSTIRTIAECLKSLRLKTFRPLGFGLFCSSEKLKEKGNSLFRRTH